MRKPPQADYALVMPMPSLSRCAWSEGGGLKEESLSAGGEEMIRRLCKRLS
jgi:hypothetical protein